MKKHHILLLTLYLITFHSYCQKHLPNVLTDSPVFIEHSKGTGTGFFLRDSLSVYFVTARHNIYDPETNMVLIDDLKLTSYYDSANNDIKNTFSLSIKEAVTENLIYSKNTVDALVINIADLKFVDGLKFAVEYKNVISKTSEASFVHSLNISNLAKYDSVYAGDEIFLFGYPTSIGLESSPQFEYSKPLIRKGVVAGKNEKLKTIILDCPSYPGNSGGPVIRKITDGLSWEYSVIGLVVQFIPYEEQWINVKSRLINTDRFNSGYSIAVSSDKILELIETN